MIATVLTASKGSGPLLAYGQAVAPDGFVSYERKSNFFKEFQVPVEARGLGGIATDDQENVWFAYSTNKTSTVFRFQPSNQTFTQYHLGGETVTDSAIIDLAAGQLVFDSKRKSIWFTDARTNSVGRLDMTNAKVQLAPIPTQNAGPMGIALAPDGNNIWFTEITGDKIAKIDPESMEITEYATGSDTGPTLLDIDEKGLLWVTLSFSNSVLRVDPMNLASSPSSAMAELKLSDRDAFSPFGIAVAGDKVYVSDHGSSRVIVADAGFVNYVSYWTSPSSEFPTTLPGQVVKDRAGNIYFPQHGGNRISAIDRSGVLTEYEIPTGPLSTAVFVSPSRDGKVWFTEWAANKIGYLDVSSEPPFKIQVESPGEITLGNEGFQSIDLSLISAEGNRSAVSLEAVEIAIVGMTESGLSGVTYDSQQDTVNLEQDQVANFKVNLAAQDGAISGKYTLMVRAAATEQDGVRVSKLYPVSIIVDVPPQRPQEDGVDNGGDDASGILLDIVRYSSLLVAIGLGGYVVYKRIKGRTTTSAK